MYGSGAAIGTALTSTKAARLRTRLARNLTLAVPYVVDLGTTVRLIAGWQIGLASPLMTSTM